MTNTNAPPSGPPATGNPGDNSTHPPYYPPRWHHEHGPPGGIFRIVGTTVVGAGAGMFFRRFILRTWSRAPVMIGASLGFGFGIMGAIARSHHAYERGYCGEGSWWRRAHCNSIYAPSGPGPNHTNAEDGSEVSRRGCHWGRSHYWSPDHQNHYHRWGGYRGYQYPPPGDWQAQHGDQISAAGAAKPQNSHCRTCGSPKLDQAQDSEVHVGTQEARAGPSAPPMDSGRSAKTDRPRQTVHPKPAAAADHEESPSKGTTGPPDETTYSYMDSVVDRNADRRSREVLPTVGHGRHQPNEVTPEKFQEPAARERQQVVDSVSRQQPRATHRDVTGVIDRRETRVEQIPYISRQEVSHGVPAQPSHPADFARDNAANEGREARVPAVGNSNHQGVIDSAPQRPSGIYPDLHNVRTEMADNTPSRAEKATNTDQRPLGRVEKSENLIDFEASVPRGNINECELDE